MDNNKKILIWAKKSILKPSGGPSGYLYNLSLQLDLLSLNTVTFLNEDNINSEGIVSNLFKKCKTIIRNPLLSIIPKSILDKSRLKKYIKYLHAKEKFNQEYFCADIIHFNDTLSLYKLKDVIDDFSGTVVLMMHTPRPPFMERYEDDLHFIQQEQKARYLDYFREIDEVAVRLADYVIFPCEESLECYKGWTYFENYLNESGKIKFLPTGCHVKKAKIEKKDYLTGKPFSNEDFIISYVGRHNHIKGYDRVVEIAKRILSKCSDYGFLLAGTQAPLTGLQHNKWLEVGFTADPHSLISASDIFILPNRSTYFDLILLEVLSLGKPALISNTGGNKFFKKFNSAGIIYFNDVDDAVAKIKELKNKKEELPYLGRCNKDIYEKYFSMNTFVNNYMSLMAGL